MKTENTTITWESIIGDFTLGKWEQQWRSVENGFKANHPDLRWKMGIWAAKLNGEIMYIGAAANTSGGLNQGLSRARYTNPTGDKGAGLGAVRKNIHRVDAFVISLPRDSSRLQIVRDLANGMRKLHMPAWNAPKEIVDTSRQAAYDRRSQR